MKELVIEKSASGYMGALFEDGKLVEIFHEELESLSGNIYVGKVERVLKALGGAFVNIGISKNAFLKLKDVTPSYIEKVLSGKDFDVGRKVLVQVKKDGTKRKGPQVTTKISIAGRFLVYFPLTRARGISRRISNKDRERLSVILKNFKEKNQGIVIRTAAEGVDISVIEEELQELKEQWEKILKAFKRARKVKLLHSPPGFLDYVLREKLDKDVKIVYTNEREIVNKVRNASKVYGGVDVKVLEGSPFDILDIHRRLREVVSRRVALEGGGEIVIDVTEAMTVVDVNTAASIKGSSQRELILKTNIQAAKEIARQLRLRNIGGIIVVDFITMDYDEDRQKVIEVLRKELRKDRAKTEVYGFTKLGLLEMARKRTSRSITSFLTTTCPVCHGSGFVLSQRVIISKIEQELSKIEDVMEVKVRLHQNVSGYVTKKLIKRWKNLAKADVEVSFDWCDPGSYDVTYIKSKGGGSG